MKIKMSEKDIKFKIFDLYETENIIINDPGLKNVINLNQKLILKSHGRNTQRFGQTKVNVVERLINRLGVSGHRGKKHKIILGNSSGKYTKNAKIVLGAFKIIEERTKKNPVEVLIRAIENSAPRDEITTIEYGGARYPQAVDVSPLRRLNLAIKHLVHGASERAFGKKKNIKEALAEEIILASEENGESYAIKKKIESEKQADSAR
ncbi:MAG: 30S ribosomal protein S7 [Candidatus Pacearchaeota archaeon]|nr:MAG: 30S ribosomal protein S7 [Candidatus Pacearchaeota archaeon]